MKSSIIRSGCILFIVLPLFIKAQSITQFALVNASTNQDIQVLTDSSTFDLELVGPNLNIRGDVSGTVGSFRFGLDANSNYQTENVSPYALAGDNNGNYNSWTPEVGFHTLSGIIYSGMNGSGSVLDTLIVTFQVKDTQDSLIIPEDRGTGAVVISGELKKWHKVTLTFDGPQYSESSINANPFLDYRLQVTFTNGSKSYDVPGYFCADGNAGETSSDSGNKWRVHFSPDLLGLWNYDVSFRIGKNVAISDNLVEGDAFPPIDGLQGTFEILSSDKIGSDFRGKGRLKYVGERYLQFSDSNEYFVKGGADAPENLLAYDDIDNTPDNGGRRKSYSPHADDWITGDPSWQSGKGTELIGALNYLHGKGVNVISFLTMNIGGDDKNVFPYISDSNFKHFDCSKLDQWEVIFEHADQLGIYLHFKTQETENDQLLDSGELGITRKLYYRELIARFSHHLALNWNMGEENSQTTQQRKDMANYFNAHDPYNHNIVIHTYPNQINAVYTPLLGSASDYTGVSIQTGWSSVHTKTTEWVQASEAAGKPWIVANDEQGNANTGVPPDPGYPGYNGSNPDLHDIRKSVLWGNLMAGGAGVEYYFGYQLPDSDLTLQNFRSRDQSWEYVDNALKFFRTLPIEGMEEHDELTTLGWCLANPGNSYILYLPDGGNTTLTLPDDSTYTLQWYNPRDGNYGDVSNITGSPAKQIGDPPSDPNEDWAVIISKDRNQTTDVDITVSNESINLYPNPTEGKVLIQGTMQAFLIQILNLTGQVVQTINAFGTAEIILNDLPSGLYFVSITNKSTGALSLHQIIKE